MKLLNLYPFLDHSAQDADVKLTNVLSVGTITVAVPCPKIPVTEIKQAVFHSKYQYVILESCIKSISIFVVILLLSLHSKNMTPASSKYEQQFFPLFHYFKNK